MKKGQVAAQVFMFLLAMIIFSMVVLYGYRAISKIGQTRNEAVLIEFKDRLVSQAKQVTLAYKDVKRVQLSLPSEFDEVCFVDIAQLVEPGNIDRYRQLGDEYPIIYDSVESGVEANVFTIPQSPISINLPNIQIDEVQGMPATEGGSWFCMKNQGGIIVLRMEGIGNKVKISPWIE